MTKKSLDGSDLHTGPEPALANKTNFTVPPGETWGPAKMLKILEESGRGDGVLAQALRNELGNPSKHGSIAITGAFRGPDDFHSEGDTFMVSKAAMARIAPLLPKSRGTPRFDDRRVISGILYVLRNRLRWREAPKVYGSHKLLYSRFARWSALGVFDRILANLAGGPEFQRIVIDPAQLRANRTAARLLGKGMFPTAQGARGTGHTSEPPPSPRSRKRPGKHRNSR